MTFDEALKKAMEGDFISSDKLDKEDHIHYYKGKFYFEDGTNFSMDYLMSIEWPIKDSNWYIYKDRSKVNRDILEAIHRNKYEKCFID